MLSNFEKGEDMKKWNVTLSTTEPKNYVGIIQVRQGNVNSEVLEAQIIQNGLPLNLKDCSATFQAFLDGEHVIERPCKIIDDEQGIVQYTFDEYSMQSLHKQKANLAFYKGGEEIATTQDFTYIVIQAVSKTAGEMGSYWQSAEELMNDMTEYLNTGKGDFETWLNSVKVILEDIDPGGVLLGKVVTFEELVKTALPSHGTFVIEHDSEYQPEVKVTSYKNAIGTEKEGLDTGPSFGGKTIFVVPTFVSYDRKKISIAVPSSFALEGEVVIVGNTLLMIEGENILNFTIQGASITGGYLK